MCYAHELTGEVTGLIHRKEYMFRVKAVNMIGESEPLTTDRSIIAKNECGAYHNRTLGLNLCLWLSFGLLDIMKEWMFCVLKIYFAFLLLNF